MNDLEQRIARLEKVVLFDSRFALYPELKRAVEDIGLIYEELEEIRIERERLRLEQEELNKPKPLSKGFITKWIATITGLVIALFGGSIQLEQVALLLQQEIRKEARRAITEKLFVPEISDQDPPITPYPTEK